MSVSAPTPVVPVDWEIAKTGEVCEVQNGSAFKSEFFNDKSAGLPLIRIRDVHSGRSDTFYSGSYDERYVVTDGDLLIGMDGEFRVRKWRSGKGLLNQRVCRLIPNGEPMIADFLYYSIGRPLKQIEDFTPFTTVKHISAGQIRTIELPLPPLPEQKKIAHILSTVQRAIEAQERIIQTTTELKKALMHKLFTEGLRHEPQKQTEIGPVPESWEVCKVGDVAKIQSGGTPTRETAENWSGGSIPWVKTGEINYCVIHDTEEKITPTGLANSSARLYPKGTLLMAMYGQGITRGRVGLLGIEAATNQACASITPTDKKRVSSVFLYYFFEYHYEDLRKLGHGANQRNMNAALIRSFPLMFPKADEQAAVVTTLESLDEKRVLHERKKTQLQDLFRTLLHELMTAKIRVADIPFADAEAWKSR
jgi:type I restriction enzyme S subunit